MEPSYCINFPRLHEELTQGSCPEHTVFLATVLFSGTVPSDSPAAELAAHMLSSFPVPLESARNNARQIQELGTDLWKSRQLETLSALSRNKEREKQARATELHDISTFITSQGNMTGGRLTEEQTKKQEASHQDETLTKLRLGKELALCIAFDMETTVLETKNAIRRLESANALLLANLHDGEEEDMQAAIPELDFEPKITASYQSIIETILPFVPQHTAFFTNDEITLELLKETGIIPAHLPASQDASGESFEQLTLPAWKLLGWTAGDPRLPWTEQSIVLVYPG